MFGEKGYMRRVWICDSCGGFHSMSLVSKINGTFADRSEWMCDSCGRRGIVPTIVNISAYCLYIWDEVKK